MGTIARGDRDDWIGDVCVHLGARAETGDWMIAVRYGDDSATFGALYSGLTAYRPVTGRQTMSLESALTASLLHNLPGVAALPPADQGKALTQILQWLGRDVPAARTAPARSHLSSVG